MPRTLQVPVVRRTSRFAAVALALALAMPVFGTPSTAEAGVIQFRDPSGMIAEDARNRLRQSTANVPFDVRVLVTSEATGGPLAQQALAALASDRMLVIAIDPMARRTSVRVGRALRIPPDRMRTLADAGDAYFRMGNYPGGVDAIVAQAAGSMRGARGRSPAGGGSSFPIGFVVLGGMVGLVVLALALSRRRAAEQPGFAGGYRSPDAPYGPPGGPYAGPPGPMGGPPGYGPHGGYGAPPQQQGHSTGTVVGAGLAGAALGGVAGYAIGRSMDNNSSHHSSSSSGYDSGYSSGGYDSGYSGGGYDGGGDDSSWGGGGDDGGGGWE